MPKFKFSLTTLKKYRERKLLSARRDLANIEGELGRREGARAMAMEGLSQAVASSRPEGSTSLALSMLYSQLSQDQHTLVEALDVEIRRIQDDAERHRNWVAHLGKELRAVEKLEDKKRTAFTLDQRRQENRRADAWVAERWTRSQETGPQNIPEKVES